MRPSVLTTLTLRLMGLAGEWGDGYVVVLKNLDTSRTGIYRGELEVQYQGRYLDSHGGLCSMPGSGKTFIAMAARNGFPQSSGKISSSKLYHQLQQASDHTRRRLAMDTSPDRPRVSLQEVEEDFEATVKDFLIPGCITFVSAPRGSGKSFVALFLGVALAKGGIFRMERLARQRVLLVDRDNPQALIRKRLHRVGSYRDLTTLKVLTRETAPPSPTRRRGALFPAEDYDVLWWIPSVPLPKGSAKRKANKPRNFWRILKNLALRGLGHSRARQYEQGRDQYPGTWRTEQYGRYCL